MKLYYFTTSEYKSKNANFINTYCMSKEFSSLFNESYSFFYNYEKESIIKEKKQTIFSLKASKGKLGLNSFYLESFLRVLSKLQNEDIIFTRSKQIILLASIFFKGTSCIELHGGIKSLFDKFLFFFLSKFKKIKFVVISDAIRMELLEFVKEEKVLLARDAHNFEISNNSICLNQPLRVGYFGSLTKQKGSDIIDKIIRHNKHINFYVYSKDQDVFEADHSNLIEYKYIQHSEVQEKMMSVDVLLLTVDYQGSEDLISRYTSPIKLYEYLSTGKPIICSNSAVLKEDVNSELVYFFDNDLETFTNQVNSILEVEPSSVKIKLRKELASKRTWKERAKTILSFLND